MKAIKGVGLFAVTAIAISSCFNPPEFAVEPQIEFESIYFGDDPVDDPNTGRSDSLLVSIKFKDGDGDLGLHPSQYQHIIAPFNQYNFFLAQDGEIKPVGISAYFAENAGYFAIDRNGFDGKLVTYKTRELEGYDFLPPFSPTSCNFLADTLLAVNLEDGSILDTTTQDIDTLVVRGTSRVVYALRDTFYVQINPNYYNITVDFLIKDANSQTFTIFEWPGFCDNPYSGRFPVLSEKDGSPLDGVLRYSIKSAGLKNLFLTKTLKLRIQVKDRALHTSNVIETPEFTLLDILR